MNDQKNDPAVQVPDMWRGSGPTGNSAALSVASPIKRGRGRPKKAGSIPAKAKKSKPAVKGPEPVATSSRFARASWDDLCKVVLGCEKEKEGARIAVLAATRHGKTTLIRRLIEYPRSCVTLIHDAAKLEAQYPGWVSSTLDLSGAPAEVTTVIFRGDVFAGVEVSVESVAAEALRLARSRVPVRLVVDELEAAVSTGGRKLTSESLLKIGVQGGQLALTLIWSTQIPQRAPSDALSQVSAVVLGRLEASATNYLDQTLYFDREMVEVLGTLQRGEFVVRVPGQSWDRTIYEG